MVNIYKNIKCVIPFIITVFVFGVFTNSAFAHKDDMKYIVYGSNLVRGALKNCLEGKWSKIYRNAIVYEITDPDIFDKVVSTDGTVKEHPRDDSSVKCLIGKPSSFDYNKNYIRSSIDHSSIPKDCRDGTHTRHEAYNNHGMSFGIGPSGPRGYGENTQYLCKKWRLFVVHNMDVGHYLCGGWLYSRSLDFLTDLVLSCDEIMKIAPFEHGDNDYDWIQDIKNKYDEYNLVEINHHKYNVNFDYFKCDNGNIAEYKWNPDIENEGKYDYIENREYMNSCGAEGVEDWKWTSYHCRCDGCAGVEKGGVCRDVQAYEGSECDSGIWGRMGDSVCKRYSYTLRAKGSKVTVRNERDIYSIKLKSLRLRHESDVKKVINVIQIYDPNIIYE